MMFYDAGTDYFEMKAWEVRQRNEAILIALERADNKTDIFEKLYELGVESIDFTDLHKMTLTIGAGEDFSYKVKVRVRERG